MRRGGGQAAEASLGAVAFALDLLAKTKEVDALLVVLVITDNLGHMGGRQNEEKTDKAAVDQLITTITAFPPAVQKRFRIYSSTVAFAGKVLSNADYPTPSDQWNDLRGRGMTAIAKVEDRGKTLEYPLSKDVLVGEFSAVLKSQELQTEICLSEKATVASGKEKVADISEGNLKASLDSYKSGKKMEWIGGKEILAEKGLKADQLSVTMEMCCFEISAVDQLSGELKCPSAERVSLTTNFGGK